MNLDTVLVDVCPWAKAAEYRGYVPINGLFRHAYALAQHFTPAVATFDGKNPVKRGLELIQARLKKPVQLKKSEEVRGVWLSLGVDQLDPANMPMQAFRAAVLHDILSVHGRFGSDACDRFHQGAKLNQAFLYVSKTSNELFSRRYPHGWRIAYGSPHHFLRSDVCSDNNDNRHYTALSVHTLFRYKNFYEELMLASKYGFAYHHVGEHGDEDPRKIESLNKNCWPFSHHQAATDTELNALYKKVKMFVCLSSEEGFSMPPMEAIIMGVPIIVLSDIPVHREIYGDYNVNFVRLDDLPALASHPPALDSFKRIPAAQRFRLFQRYSFLNLIRPFEDFVEEL
jgi:glycosyltransferase involved in cell wall biosynthesis